MPESVGGSGGCLCGGVRYQVTGGLRDVSACHCTQCRKTTGHFGAFSACLDDDLSMEMEDTLAWYHSSPGARRGFCSRCGSTLFWKNESLNYTAIAAGSLDQPTGVRLVKHIFVADKGDYYEIED